MTREDQIDRKAAAKARDNARRIARDHKAAAHDPETETATHETAPHWQRTARTEARRHW